MTDNGPSVLDAIADLRSAIERQFAGVERQFAAVEQQFAGVNQRFNALDERLAPMRAQLDGLPLISRSVTVIQQEVRALRAAFNDFALTNPTAGEIEALHQDVNRV